MLSRFLNFFTSKDLVFNNSEETGFKLDFSNPKSQQSASLGQSSSSSISSMIVLLVLFLCSNFLTAQVITVDGNTADWSGNPSVKHVQDPFNNGTIDNQFTQGSKDFLFANQLTWAIGLGKVILSYDGNSVGTVVVPPLKSIA